MEEKRVDKKAPSFGSMLLEEDSKIINNKKINCVNTPFPIRTA